MREINYPGSFAAILVIVIGTVNGVFAEDRKPAPWETLSPAPLPPMFETLQPAADLPSYLVGMIGVWRGKWAGTLDSFIVVRNIDTKHAQVHYSWGTNMLVKQAGYVNVDANVVGSKLEYTFQVGYGVSFELSADGGIILGRYNSPGKVIEAYFEKVDDVPVSVPARQACGDSVGDPKLSQLNEQFRCTLLE